MKEKILKCLHHYDKIALRQPKTKQQILNRAIWERLNKIWRRYDDKEHRNQRTKKRN